MPGHYRARGRFSQALDEELARACSLGEQARREPAPGQPPRLMAIAARLAVAAAAVSTAEPASVVLAAAQAAAPPASLAAANPIPSRRTPQVTLPAAASFPGARHQPAAC